MMMTISIDGDDDDIDGDKNDDNDGVDDLIRCNYLPNDDPFI